MALRWRLLPAASLSSSIHGFLYLHVDYSSWCCFKFVSYLQLHSIQISGLGFHSLFLLAHRPARGIVLVCTCSSSNLCVHVWCCACVCARIRMPAVRLPLSSLALICMFRNTEHRHGARLCPAAKNASPHFSTPLGSPPVSPRNVYTNLWRRIDRNCGFPQRFV